MAKSLPFITATTQIAGANDEQTGTTDMQTNAGPSIAVAATATVETAFPNHSSINNINNNDDRQRPERRQDAAVVLQANLIMSNRNVEQQDPYEHNYKITQHNALFPDSNSSTAAIEVAAMATAATEQSTATATATPTMTTAATTTTTTRRPAPKTTLKPPPTIDDYQTIISQAGTHAYLPCNVSKPQAEFHPGNSL